VDHTSWGKTVSLLQTIELWPGHVTIAASPRQPTSPDLSHFLSEILEAGGVASNPVIPEMASQLLREFLVLFLDRKMQILATPFRQRG
jgi:hypothetical protein